MNENFKRKYIIETKDEVIKTNETSSKHHVNKRKIYSEEEVKEMLKLLMEEKDNESDI